MLRLTAVEQARCGYFLTVTRSPVPIVLCAFLGLGACMRSVLQSEKSEYRVVHGWPVLPDGQALDIVTGVGVDSHDNAWVFHRAGRAWPKSGPLDPTPIARPPVILFDGRTGSLLSAWGAGTFAMPHG